jgi:hypothetical protein
MPSQFTPRPSLAAKAVITAGLIVIADQLFYGHELGLNLGLFGLVLSAAALAAFPALRRDRRGLIVIALATCMALLLLERPTVAITAFLLVALGTASLSPRAPGGYDAWLWGQRLVVGAFRALIRPLTDLRRLRGSRLARRSLPLSWVKLSTLVLPLVGGLAFFTLFSAANPIIEASLAAIRIPRMDLARGVFWLATAATLWGFLRPRGPRRAFAPPDGRGDLQVFGVTQTSLTLSLMVFNALFALQNGLDLAFLWSGAPLPAGVTLAEYAHRGAYLLIATAILAGAFVLIALRPGSTTASRPMVRRMVVLFVAQNLLLVASSALRTVDYVEAYGLTRLRISALAWMGLVAVGLVLIGVRLLRDKSSSWLINANVLTAAIVLLGTSLVDLGAVAAHWNTRNAREIGGQGPPLDLGYLRGLGGAALVPLTTLEGRLPPTPQREALAATRLWLTANLRRKQADWRTWSWRDQRRLDATQALLLQLPPPVQAPAPLTDASQPGT